MIVVRRVRLYSTKTFKSLGSLVYHKKNCQSVAFARSRADARSLGADAGVEGGVEEAAEDMSEAEKEERARWLVSGGQDSRVVVWSLMDFNKS